MCPVCRQYANSVMPFIPAAENSINPHCGTTLNTNIKITVLTDAVNKLSELIETVTEYQNSAPVSIYNIIFILCTYLFIYNIYVIYPLIESYTNRK